jgi:hypothetical protein
MSIIRLKVQQGIYSLAGDLRTGIISRLKAQQGIYSLADDSRTGIISWLEICKGTETTHSLESKGEKTSAGMKQVGAQKPHQLVRKADE